FLLEKTSEKSKKKFHVLEKDLEAKLSTIKLPREAESLKSYYHELEGVFIYLSLNVISEIPTHSREINEAYLAFRDAVVDLRKDMVESENKNHLFRIEEESN